MDRFIIVVIFTLSFYLLSIGVTLSQIDLGMRAGLNYPKNLSFDRNLENGFHLGPYLKLSLFGIVAVEPSAQYVQSDWINNNGESQQLKYFDFPIVARISLLPFLNLFAGPQYSFLLANRTKLKSMNYELQEEGRFIPGGTLGLGLKLPLGFNVQGSYDFSLPDNNDLLRRQSLVKFSIGKNF